MHNFCDVHDVLLAHVMDSVIITKSKDEIRTFICTIVTMQFSIKDTKETFSFVFGVKCNHACVDVICLRKQSGQIMEQL